MKTVIITIIGGLLYLGIVLLIARFCGTNTRLEKQEVEENDRSNSN